MRNSILPDRSPACIELVSGFEARLPGPIILRVDNVYKMFHGLHNFHVCISSLRFFLERGEFSLK